MAGILLMRLQPRLEHKEVKDRIESLYENIDSERRTALTFTVLFLQRRLVYAFSLVVLQAYPTFQMALLFLQSILMFAFLVLVKPFTKHLTNTVEILNELGILLCAYHLIAYTNFQPDPVIGYNFGMSMIAFTVLIALLNIGTMCYQTFNMLKHKYSILKQKCMRRSIQKYQESPDQNMDVTKYQDNSKNFTYGGS